MTPASTGAPTCDLTECGSAPAIAWQRYATRAEYDQLAATPLRPRDGIVRIAVRACVEHAVTGDQATFTHRSDCTMPGSPCQCGAHDPIVVYEVGTDQDQVPGHTQAALAPPPTVVRRLRG